MNALKQRIINHIAVNGPMRVDDYMHLCLADAEYGYYRTAKPFGAEGDFTTAPEISQLFGELIGVWIIASWQQFGQDHQLQLCEGGPGRGTLMHDILRTIKGLAPQLYQNLKVKMLETSPQLIKQQQKKLQSFMIDIAWIETIQSLDAAPTIFIANELFDALPIRQLIASDGKFYERMITYSDDQGLHFIKGPATIDDGLRTVAQSTLADNTIIEIAPIRTNLMDALCSHIEQHNGAALLIDYGSLTRGTGDTLQAMSKHQYRDIFANPGMDDLTSHVDFDALANVAKQHDLHCAGTTQAEFLLAMGLLERAGQLGRDKDAKVQAALTEAVNRLAGADQMGNLFKVLACSRLPLSLPPFQMPDHP